MPEGSESVAVATKKLFAVEPLIDLEPNVDGLEAVPKTAIWPVVFAAIAFGSSIPEPPAVATGPSAPVGATRTITMSLLPALVDGRALHRPGPLERRRGVCVPRRPVDRHAGRIQRGGPVVHPEVLGIGNRAVGGQASEEDAAGLRGGDGSETNAAVPV